MSNQKRQHLWGLLLILISCILTAVITYGLSSLPDEIKHLEYESLKQNNLSGIFGNPSQLKIILEGKETKELSRIHFFIYNRTGQNLENVKLYFSTKDGMESLIFHETIIPDHYPKEAIKSRKVAEGFEYEFKYINWSDDVRKRGFGFSFYFASRTVPDINIVSGTKGVEIKELEKPSTWSLDWLALFFAKTWWLLAIIISFLGLTTVYDLKKEAIAKARQDKALDMILKDHPFDNNAKQKLKYDYYLSISAPIKIKDVIIDQLMSSQVVETEKSKT